MGHLLYTLVIFPVAEIIEFCFTILYRVTNDYGIATVGLSFAVTLLTLPIYMVAERWQGVERDKEMAMAPKVGRIRKAFRGDERFMMLSAYYREQGYKPVYALRSAFSILVQIPFFLAAYAFLSNLPALRGCPFWVLEDLGSPDGLLRAGSVRVNVLPVVMTVANCVAGYLYTKGHPLREKVQVYGMAGLFLVVLYGSPSGLLVYWTMNNILSLVKNIFYKLRHPVKVLLGVMYVCLAAICVAVTRRGTGRASTLFIIYGGSLFLALVPLWYYLLRLYYRRGIRWLDSAGKIRDGLFFVGMGGYLFLLGGLIPLNLISSSPTEFAFLEPYSNPLVFAGFAFLQALGFFLWATALYKMFPVNMQSCFTVGAVCLFVVGLLDTFLFQGSYGSMLVGLQFSNASMGGHGARQLGNLVVLLLACMLVGLLFTLKWSNVLMSVCSLLLGSLVGMGVIRIFAIQRGYREYVPEHQKAVAQQEGGIGNLTKVFTFTRSGKNVLLVMLDRGMSAYVPYLLDEKPELREQFSGFTWYPNTISFGEDTLHGAASLYGGYEYTPLEMQAKSNIPMVEKHNEALKVLPKLFSDHGYEVVITNPPWSNYKWYFDGTPFEGMAHVKAEGITSRYASWWKSTRFSGKTIQYSKLLECNMLRYAFLETAPLATHAILYDNGTWLNELNPELNTTGGLDDLFVRQYATVDALPFITAITDDPTDRYNSFDTELPHEEVILHLPDYIPVENPEEGDHVAPVENVKQYHVNAASFRLLARWFDYLKEQGVYDNTRIVLVSDHGAQSRRSAAENLALPLGKHLDQYRALLMVKDFGASGPIQEDSSFMTNADTPALLTQDLLAYAVNPYTGQKITMEGKQDGVTITTANKWKPEENGKYTLTIDPDQWLEVHDDIFQIENWKQVRR